MIDQWRGITLKEILQRQVFSAFSVVAEAFLHFGSASDGGRELLAESVCALKLVTILASCLPTQRIRH